MSQETYPDSAQLLRDIDEPTGLGLEMFDDDYYVGLFDPESANYVQPSPSLPQPAETSQSSYQHNVNHASSAQQVMPADRNLIDLHNVVASSFSPSWVAQHNQDPVHNNPVQDQSSATPSMFTFEPTYDTGVFKKLSEMDEVRGYPIRNTADMSKFKLDRPRQVALLVSTRGTIAAVKCTKCEKNLGVFSECVTLEGVAGGACTNCLWDHFALKCEHHEEHHKYVPRQYTSKRAKKMPTAEEEKKQRVEELLYEIEREMSSAGLPTDKLSELREIL